MTPDHSELLKAVHDVALDLALGDALQEMTEQAAALAPALRQLSPDEMRQMSAELEPALAQVTAAAASLSAWSARTSSTSHAAAVTFSDAATLLDDLTAEVARFTFYLDHPGASHRPHLWAFVTGQAAKSAEAGRQGCTRQHTRAQLRPSRPEKDHAEQAPRRRRCSHAPRPAIAAPQGGEESDHAAPVGAKPFRAGRPSEVLII